MKTRILSNSVIFVLAIVGCLIALLLTAEYFHPGIAPCSIGPSGCTGTSLSRYGHFGPIPTALFGLGMYATVAGLCVMRRKQLRALQIQRAREAGEAAANPPEPVAPAPVTSSFFPPSPYAEKPVEPPVSPAIKRLDVLIWGISLTGIAVSWWLQYAALFLIYKFCPWCVSSAILISLIFLLSSRDYFYGDKAPQGEQKLMIGTGAFLCVLVGVLLWPVIGNQIKIVLQNSETGTKQIDDPYLKVRPILVRQGLQMKGDPYAPYLIVEFADYMCPKCKESIPAVEDIVKQHRDKLHFAFRNFPIPGHQWSPLAAQAAEAAGNQGKFWQMHDAIYDHQADMEETKFTPEEFARYGRDLGLDVARFTKDTQSKKISEKVQNDTSDGNRLGVSSTPTFFFVPPAPKPITMFRGLEQMEEALANPNSTLWK